MFRPANGGWSAEEQVNDVTTGNQFWPALAVDDQGNAYATWNDLRNGYNRARPVLFDAAGRGRMDTQRARQRRGGQGGLERVA